MSDTPRKGMSRGTARAIEYSIVGLSIVTLLLLFQPFDLGLFTFGAGLIIVVGLLFNLVPMAQPGKTMSGLLKGFVVIVVAFAIITGLALLSAYLYGRFMTGVA